MKKRIVLIVVAILLVVIGVLFFDDSNDFVCFGSKCVEVEVADSSSERAKGLMFRENLDENSGMLFVYEDLGVYNFWMKNTLIPLDIIWIDSDYEVVWIERAVPCVSEECEVYGSLEEVRYVLEVNAGFVLREGIEVGDRIVLNL